MSIKEFFNEFPIQEPRELKHEDLKLVLDFCNQSVEIYKKDNTYMTKDEKIKSYKEYCRQKIGEKFNDLNLDGKVELDKFFNLYGTHAILQHLAD